MCLELSDHLDQKPPEFLYHYTTAQGIEGIFKKSNLNIRFTNTNYVNDRSEGNELIDIIKEVACKLKEIGKISKEYYNKIISTDFKFSQFYKNENCYYYGNTNTYIFCLCEDGDSLPMWNFYSKGESNYGYNIKFKAEVLKNCAEYQYKEKLVNLKKVIYNDDEKEKIVQEIVLNEYANNSYDKAIKVIVSNLFPYQFLFKKKCFEYEKEWRLIFYDKKSLKYQQCNLHNLRNYFTLGTPAEDIYCVNNICIGPLNNNTIVHLGLKQYLTENTYDYFLDKITNSNIPLRKT